MSAFANPVLPAIAYEFRLPKFHPVKQLFPDESVGDVDAAIDRAFEKPEIRQKIGDGASVALLVGSRGICALDQVVRRVVCCVKALGGVPFIVPAMGSHGNGNAAEQRSILHGYGVTEAAMGAPIVSCMDVIQIGVSEHGLPVYADKSAAKADVIIPICRVKCHTDFRGPYESGICKMLAIGLGKHTGCARMHQESIADFPVLIPGVARVVLKKLNVGCAVALIENAHEHLNRICVLSGDKILEEEPKLLQYSKSLMPHLQFRQLDVLIVDSIGKDITGAGMDPNITGRKTGTPFPDYKGPAISRIIVNHLTPNSHGNAVGIGLSDFTTDEVYRQIDFGTTYTNCIASGDPQCARLPLVMPDEETAIRAAIVTSPGVDKNNPRIVRIQDTLHITRIEVSDALLDECGTHPGMRLL